MYFFLKRITFDIKKLLLVERMAIILNLFETISENVRKNV